MTTIGDDNGHSEDAPLPGQRNFFAVSAVLFTRTCVIPYAGLMSIYIARHGQTDWNLLGKWQSRTDVPLNKTGYRQAEKLRDKLAEQGVRFNVAMTSPLVRAVETAKVLLEGSHVIAQDNLALIELDMGDYEGRKEKDVRAVLGDDQYDQWRSTMMCVPAPGGESITDVARRLQPVVTWLSQQIGSVLIVGHQYVNMALKAQLCDRFGRSDLLEFKQANDEIDIWDHQSRQSIGLIKLDEF